ncbi:protein kinase domain-containing protein [Streptomyces sp. CBMA152]|uniref:protein kinase domain-containing protein n=1 Tax=Streptomyces sp. CBMA152 TaxID=1896312 RepID=UPI0016614DC0|nr:protein kinase [Streptomyces sp. CBMA152]MBD0747348.1 protein kinase [Streptomyces sp. CBMA152]
MTGLGPFEIPDPVPVTPLSQRLVLNRRGSTVWDVDTPTGRVVVKLGYRSETHAWTALAPAREGVILQALGTAAATYGQWDQGTWNVQPWLAGTDLQHLWEPHRTRDSPSRPPLPDALACARALAELHDKDVVHGDVQPAHFIVRDEPARAALIDLALARGVEVPEWCDFAYRGCLVHYESPEISRRVLEDGEAVPTRQADVYALGATLFMAATGWRHVEYPDDASRAIQRQAIVTGTHRPVNVAGTLGALIRDMLRYDADDRPTIQEVCKALDQAAA